MGVIAALGVSASLNLPRPTKKKRFEIYIAAAAGTLIGAKIPVWISYGLSVDTILSGKSIMGGILGAFLSLNLYKYLTHQGDKAFGGRFAIPLAVAVGFGKIGCYFNGCCAGHWFVPVQLVESAFQFSLAAALFLFYRRTHRIDLLFPIYLLCYLVMRFAIEFIRTEPRVLMNLTIYQWLAMIFCPVMIATLKGRRSSNA
jgi:phosphatidylglycerol:prolipoprotein diacylglycerol transferase